MTENKNYTSWGLSEQRDQRVHRLTWRQEKLPEKAQGESYLPYGNGRSYGDSCLNKEGISIDSGALDHLISFNPKTHILRTECGVMITEILKEFVTKGWFLPVSPGTQYVTVGGAIANDVHGKNHHRRGSFGNHVIRVAILRSDGEVVVCSRTENAELFRATIGGLGLTGLIIWADILLMPIDSPNLHVETQKFDTLGDFFDLSAASEWKYEYTVAWVDCASEKEMGRGIFIRANHCTRASDKRTANLSKGSRLPFNLPGYLINNMTSRAFNALYYNAHPPGTLEQELSYGKFFYPLDRIKNWNRLYGKKGFFQYQCVVPLEDAKKTIRYILDTVRTSGNASSLAVLKIFGDIQSVGMLSFPRQGVTLAMDFPNRGNRVLNLFDHLDRIVVDVGGAVYPAKDARMSAENFKHFFPRCYDFKEFIDPAFSSTFWRRVMG